MTELSELKRVWQESAAESIGGCSKEELRMVLQGRSADVKKQILNRVTNEIKTYLWIGLFLLGWLALGGFSSGRALSLGAAALLVVIPAIAALAYKEYRLSTLPMSGTVRQSVLALVQAVDSTERTYLYTYVASIAVSLVLIGLLLVSRNGWNLVTAGFVVGAIAFVCWSYASGRRYASRMFRSYRADLVSVLEELERV